jgi:hypothetical protein
MKNTPEPKELTYIDYINLVIENRFRLLVIFVVGCVLGACVLLAVPRYYSYWGSIQIPRINDANTNFPDASRVFSKMRASDKLDNDLLAQVYDYLSFRYIGNGNAGKIEGVSTQKEAPKTWQSRLADNTVMRNLLTSPFMQVIKRVLYGKEKTSEADQGPLRKTLFFDVEDHISDGRTTIKKLSFSEFKQFLIVEVKSLRPEHAKLFLEQTVIPDLKTIFQPNLDLVFKRIDERGKIIDRAIDEANKDLNELIRLKSEVGAHSTLQQERLEVLKRLMELGNLRIEVESLRSYRSSGEIRLTDSGLSSRNQGSVPYTYGAVAGGFILCFLWIVLQVLIINLSTASTVATEVASEEDNVVNMEDEKDKRIG